MGNALHCILNIIHPLYNNPALVLDCGKSYNNYKVLQCYSFNRFLAMVYLGLFYRAGPIIIMCLTIRDAVDFNIILTYHVKNTEFAATITGITLTFPPSPAYRGLILAINIARGAGVEFIMLYINAIY
jgi:hypothetical protein